MIKNKNVVSEKTKYIEENERLRELLWLHHGCDISTEYENKLWCTKCRINFEANSIEYLEAQFRPKEMGEKVYCIECEFLESSRQFIQDSDCNHPNNIKDNWYEPNGQKKDSPTALNKNNDCKGFKER